MKTIYIPTIKTSLRDYQKLIGISHEILTSEENIKLDFSRAESLKQNSLVAIESLRKRLEIRNRTIVIDLGTVQPQLLSFLRNMNFPLDRYAKKTTPTGLYYSRVMGGTPTSQKISRSLPARDANSIPFSTFLPDEDEKIFEFLEKEWLGSGWINLSSELEGRIVGTTWEIFANAFEHSTTQQGVCVCGMHSKEDFLELSVMDNGIGIPAAVAKHLKKFDICHAKALE